MKYITKYWIVIIIVFFLSALIKPALCMLFFGSLVFYIGIKIVLSLRKLHKKGITCTGKIIEYQSDEEGYKTPVVEFSPLSGGQIKEQPSFYASSDLSKIRSYKNMIDQEVSIIYDPDDPKKFILTDEEEFNYFFLLLLFVVGAVLIGVSIGSFLGYIKLGSG